MYHQIDQKQGTRQHFKSTPGHSLFVLHCIRQFQRLPHKNKTNTVFTPSKS